MHTYTISLRIESPDLELAQVTSELGLQPTQTRAKGDRRSENTVWEKALWEFEVFPDDRAEWESLEAGLVELVRMLRPHLRLLQKYKESYELYLGVAFLVQALAAGRDCQVRYWANCRPLVHRSCWRFIQRHAKAKKKQIPRQARNDSVLRFLP
jgi:Domain of unknown function (DUF4279)